jgi:hypothetical protein
MEISSLGTRFSFSEMFLMGLFVFFSMDLSSFSSLLM